LPHVPQLPTSLSTRISHPSVATLLQSSRSELQANAHAEPEQLTLAPETGGQAESHAPQWLTLLVVSTQLEPQSVVPAPQLAAQANAPPPIDSHNGVGAPQETPQAPQVDTEEMSASHPSAVDALQSSNPELQLRAHSPLTQLATPFAPPQAVPHAPQLSASVMRSKPSSEVPSQSSSAPLQISVNGVQVVVSTQSSSGWQRSSSPQSESSRV